MLSERMENAAAAASELMRVPLTYAGIGTVIMVLPIAIVFFAPLLLALTLLLTPLLLPIGFGLTAFGLGRAGMIVTLKGSPPPPRRRRLTSRDEPDDEDDDSIVEMQGGTFRDLQRVAKKRSGELVRQVGALVKHNVHKASMEVRRASPASRPEQRALAFFAFGGARGTGCVLGHG